MDLNRPSLLLRLPTVIYFFILKDTLIIILRFSRQGIQPARCSSQPLRTILPFPHGDLYSICKHLGRFCTKDILSLIWSEWVISIKQTLPEILQVQAEFHLAIPRGRHTGFQRYHWGKTFQTWWRQLQRSPHRCVSPSFCTSAEYKSRKVNTSQQVYKKPKNTPSWPSKNGYATLFDKTMLFPL